MRLIDLHCDTILGIVDTKGAVELRKNELCIDVQRLKQANSLAQFFAMYIDLELDKEPLKRCLEMIDCFNQEIKKNSEDLAFAQSLSDLRNNEQKEKISAFLTVEEGGVLEDKLENLSKLHQLGVRLITLVWNYPNCIGFPNHEWKYKDHGLTAFGEQVVTDMNRLGMIIDVSHLSDQGFYDVAKLSNAPFVASHSNARAVELHSRNLSDDMLKLLANKGGVTGINFEPTFLGDGGTVERMVAHIKHIRKVAGVETIAIGTDFDGTSPLQAIKHVAEMEKLVVGLTHEGFTVDEIEKIMYKNTERVIGAVLNK